MKKNGQSISIGILVLLVVALICSSIIIFLTTSGKFSSKIYDAKFLEKFYLKENVAEFYLKKTGEEALKKTYVNAENEPETDFVEKFISNFKTEFARYKFEEEYLKNLQNSIHDGNFTATLNEKGVNLEVRNFVLKENYSLVESEYSPRIFLEIERKV